MFAFSELADDIFDPHVSTKPNELKESKSMMLRKHVNCLLLPREHSEHV